MVGYILSGSSLVIFGVSCEFYYYYYYHYRYYFYYYYHLYYYL